VPSFHTSMALPSLLGKLRNVGANGAVSKEFSSYYVSSLKIIHQYQSLNRCQKYQN
jgi:hypothetical protein